MQINKADEGWTILSGNDKERPDTTGFYSARVPIVYRGMQLRADGVASIPFDLVDDSGDVKDSSDDWKNECGFLPDPETMFWKAAASRTVSGEMYWYKSMNTHGITKILRPLAPATVKYKLDKDVFVRGVLGSNGAVTDKIYQPALGDKGVPTPGESIVFSWMDDPDVEKGPPLKFPAKAALSAMGVLFNMDDAANGFFKRGMLHTYAFQVPAGTQARDKEELEERVKNMLSGIRNAWRTIFTNVDLGKPVDLGGGLNELANVPLVAEERENVTMALGIPYSKLFSEKANALGGKGVVDADDRRMIKDTCLPEWLAIARDLNTQVFEPMGRHLQDRHEEMQMFQENETDRSVAIVNLTNAFNTNTELALLIADTMGLNIPDEDLAKLQKIVDDKNAEPDPKPVTDQTGIVQNPSTSTTNEDPNNPLQQGNVGSQEMLAEKMTTDLDKWKRKALKAVGKSVPFESDAIPAEVAVKIAASLVGCKTAEDVRAVFSSVNGDMINTANPNQLVEMMRMGVRALNAN